MPRYRSRVRASFPAPYGPISTQPIHCDGLLCFWGACVGAERRLVGSVQGSVLCLPCVLTLATLEGALVWAYQEKRTRADPHVRVHEQEWPLSPSPSWSATSSSRWLDHSPCRANAASVVISRTSAPDQNDFVRAQAIVSVTKCVKHKRESGQTHFPAFRPTLDQRRKI